MILIILLVVYLLSGVAVGLYAAHEDELSYTIGDLVFSAILGLLLLPRVFECLFDVELINFKKENKDVN